MPEQIKFMLIILPFLVILLVYLFGRWKFRKSIMKKLAKEMDLTFQEIDKKSFELKGCYKGKDIIITESKYVMSSFGGTVLEKALTITIEKENIYRKKGEIFFPFTGKIKKIIDDYINKGTVPKKHTKLAWMIVVILFILLAILQFVRIKNG